MEGAREFTLSILKGLIESSREEYSMYMAACKKVNDSKLKQILKNYITQKEEYIKKLESEIKRLGGNQPNTALESNLNSDSLKYFAEDCDDNILNECVEKNKSTLNKYSTAINEDILWEVVPLIAKQYFDSKNMHNNLVYIYGKMHPTTINVV